MIKEYRILSTGFMPCYRCGHKHIQAILTPGNYIDLPPKYEQWWYVDVKCRNKGCGLRLHRRTCLPKKADIRKWFKEARIAWNTRLTDTSLVKFAIKVIGAYCWGYDSMDGLDIQDLAEVLGLLEQHTVVKEDVDEESDFEVGDMIYKFSEILKE